MVPEPIVVAGPAPAMSGLSEWRSARSQPTAAAIHESTAPHRDGRHVEHRTHLEARRLVARQRVYRQGRGDGQGKTPENPTMASAGIHGVSGRRVAKENDQESRERGAET